MWFLGLGLLLIFLKYNEMTMVATWSWWWVLSPLLLAVLWWAWADASGYTKRKAMEKMDKVAKERREKSREKLGLGVGNKRR
jgi:small Trp-rich protein